MLKKKCVLVVDDEEISRTVLVNNLNRLGYDTIAAINGQEALDKIQEFNCDVVITDIKMPEMDGVELLQKIKQLKPDVGVIMVTAHSEVDSYLEAKTLGAFEYLRKPVKIDALDTVLTNMLGAKN